VFTRRNHFFGRDSLYFLPIVSSIFFNVSRGSGLIFFSFQSPHFTAIPVRRLLRNHDRGSFGTPHILPVFFSQLFYTHLSLHDCAASCVDLFERFSLLLTPHCLCRLTWPRLAILLYFFLPGRLLERGVFISPPTVVRRLSWFTSCPSGPEKAQTSPDATKCFFPPTDPRTREPSRPLSFRAGEAPRLEESAWPRSSFNSSSLPPLFSSFSQCHKQVAPRPRRFSVFLLGALLS